MTSTSRSSGSSNRRQTQSQRDSFLVESIHIFTVPARRGVMNHSYRDYSKVPPSPAFNAQRPTDVNDMTFAQKIHTILSEPTYQVMISWMPHGRTFKVHQPAAFEKQVCPKYFGHGRYSSFLRALNNYGFKHLTKGPDRNCYYHQFMLRGRFHLCTRMPRVKEARRLLSDPEHEPDFYLLSRLLPLDGSAPSTTEESIHGVMTGAAPIDVPTVVAKTLPCPPSCAIPNNATAFWPRHCLRNVKSNLFAQRQQQQQQQQHPSLLLTIPQRVHPRVGWESLLSGNRNVNHHNNNMSNNNNGNGKNNNNNDLYQPSTVALGSTMIHRLLLERTLEFRQGNTKS